MPIRECLPAAQPVRSPQSSSEVECPPVAPPTCCESTGSYLRWNLNPGIEIPPCGHGTPFVSTLPSLRCIRSWSFVLYIWPVPDQRGIPRLIANAPSLSLSPAPAPYDKLRVQTD